MLFAIWCVVLLFLLLLRLWKLKNDHFKESGIKYMKLHECVRDIYRCVIGSMSVTDYFDMMAHPYSGERYIGTFQVLSPSIILRHPIALKRVCIEKADCFVNHRKICDDPILSNMLFCMQDEKWKKMRSDLSPAASGKKIQYIFDLTLFCCKHMVDVLKKSANEQGTTAKDFDAKIIARNYGISILSKMTLGDISEASAKEIETYLSKTSPFSGNNLFKMFLLGWLPQFLRFERLKVTPPDAMKYFSKLFNSAVKWRSEKKTYIPDFIQMLTSTENEWTMVDKIAQMQAYSMAFWSTIPAQLSNTLYELSHYPEVLNRLQKEIDAVDAELQGEITLDTLNGMEYLDMVIAESFRKWPAASITDRFCSNDCDLGPVRENSSDSYTIRKGQVVGIPIISIHTDPEFWPNPKVFDPERFSKENKRNIVPLTYIPFGVGPRNCIAVRPSFIFLKLFIYYIVLNFNIKPGTAVDCQDKVKCFTLLKEVSNGVWLRLESRNY